MPLYYRCGNIFTAQAQVLVNPVNCVGVMGKGLALQLKQRYPEMFRVYREARQMRRIAIGKLFLCTRTTPQIVCFPTKDHYARPSQPSYIEEGLQGFVRACSD